MRINSSNFLIQLDKKISKSEIDLFCKLRISKNVFCELSYGVFQLLCI